MDDLDWLKEMFRQEMDLRPASLAKIGDNSVFIRDEKGGPIAHATLSKRWGSVEINSVIVDPARRGEGLAHKLVEGIGGGRMFAYTRDSRLRSVLLKAGFRPALFPGFLPTINLVLGRTLMFTWMILTFDLKRIFHQFSHLFSYKLYLRK